LFLWLAMSLLVRGQAIAQSNTESSQTTATPVFSPVGGTFPSAQTVQITAATANSTIFYTTDGTTPSTASKTYTTPIPVSQTQTIKAVAVAAGLAQSPQAAQTYTIAPPPTAPFFTPAGGAYVVPPIVTIVDPTPGATIYYTTNGTAPTASSTRYTGAFTLQATGMIRAIAIAPGGSQSQETDQAYTLTPPAAMPVPSVAAGTYGAPQSVGLADATPGASIYYTTNGAVPTTYSPRYTSPISVTYTQTINAIALANGYSQSAMTTASYTITPSAATPVLTPAPGTYNSSQNVMITDTTPAAVIYYTTNGTAPSSSSMQYTGPIALTANATIRAIAVSTGYTISATATAAYIIALPAPQPSFAPAAGTYLSSQSITIAESIPGAIIYYTTNGSAPTTASAICSGPVPLSSTATVNAIAVAPGYSQSPQASAAYTITPPAAAPLFSMASGTYNSSREVVINDVTPGAVVYYTTDGSTPTSSSPEYAGPILFKASGTLNAMAVAPGYSPSTIATASYVIVPPTPRPAFSIPAGTYILAQAIGLTDTAPGATFYYTTDGSAPTTSSNLYTTAIPISSTTTINAIALAPGYSQSAVVTATYTITPPAPAPVLTPSGGSYNTAQSVTIADAAPGATIYYTTNGTAPTAASTQYIGPIAVSTPQSINAVAIAPGFSQSAAATATFSFPRPLQIAIPASLPAAYIRAPYSASIQCFGGGPKYTWTVNGVALPTSGSPIVLANGIALSNNGSYILSLSGTPTAIGTVQFSVAVMDNYSGSQAGPTNFSLSVNTTAALTLPAPTPATLGPTTAHASYLGYLGVTGGVPPYTWTVTGLPETLTWQSSTAISTLAGNGSPGYAGDNGSAMAAEIDDTGGVAADDLGNLYFSDAVSSRIRVVTAAGSIFTVAGTGAAGYNGDNIQAAAAELNAPAGLAVDRAGNLYIADAGNNRIRMVSAATGQITTVAGNGTAGYNGDGISATIAELNLPVGVALDAAGDIYIADSANARVREVFAASGEIGTVAGTGVAAYIGDGGPALQARLKNPYAIAVDGANNLYIADLTGAAGATGTTGRIREVSAATGVIFTLAGDGLAGYNGDGIAAVNAELSNPVGITLDGSGNLYIADAGNNRVRMVSAGMGTISTVAGTGIPVYNGDNIAAISASISRPQGVAADGAGNVYIADQNGRMRMVQTPAKASYLVVTGTPAAAGPITFQASVQDSTGTAAGPISYSISVAAPLLLALPAPNPGSIGAAVVNQPYSGSIGVAGGVPNYTWTVNGARLSSNGLPVPLAGGLTVSTYGGNTLSIGGAPSAVGVISFAVAVKDGMGNLAGTNTYSIDVVAAPGYQVSGQVSFVNCGTPAAGIPLTIDTNPVQLTSTGNNGQFTFANVANGSYTITPSSAAPSSIFYPVSQPVAVNGEGVTGIAFATELGYIVSGSVTLPAGVGGRTYVNLVNNNCPEAAKGASIPASTVFAIHGVEPGSYTLQAWVDELGYGQANANDAAAVLLNVNVGYANASNVSVTPVQPAPAVLSTAPAILAGGGYSGGAFLEYSPILGAGSVEQAASYTLQWSASASFATVVGSRSFNATGGNGSTDWFVNSLKSGSVYYFRAQGVAGGSASPWSSVWGPVTIGVPSAGNTVTGTVTFSGVATGPLYVGLRDQGTGNTYLEGIVSPLSPQPYSVKVPTGSNYAMFAFIDQNRDGMVDTGDMNGMSGGATMAVTGNTTANFTLPPANTASVTTQHFRWADEGGASDTYALNFNVAPTDILPWRVSLLSGPNVLAPMDIGDCTSCGQQLFDFSIDIGGAVPSLGDTYTLQLLDPCPSGGTYVTTTAAVTGVVNAFAANLSPTTGVSSSSTPTFTWSDPPNAGNFTYQFTLWDAYGDVVWQIPAMNSSSSGFSSSIASIVWGTDPTGANNPPSIPSLSPNEAYVWSILVQDSYGNTAEMPATYRP
jgi:sugar lactone lactonase YvrE